MANLSNTGNNFQEEKDQFFWIMHHWASGWKDSNNIVLTEIT